MSTEAVTIIGAGQAGFQMAAAMRELGHQGSLVLVGEESSAPYQRPPLSKAFLSSEMGRDSLAFRSPQFFGMHDIDLRVNATAVAIDRRERLVHFADGKSVGYDRLVLATGTRPRKLPVPGSELNGVFTLRTLHDAERIAACLRDDTRLTVVGGGFIGLEVAAARPIGSTTTIVESATRLMARVVSEPVSDYFARAHQEWGAQLLLGETVKSFAGKDGRLRAVELGTGEVVATDVAVVGIGAIPNTELATQCGLKVDNGIVVDAHLRTSDECIWAIGDCANFLSTEQQKWMRLESVQNAVDQALCVAHQLTGRRSLQYASVPWFWSTQRDIRLQIAGLTTEATSTVVRHGAVTGRLSVFCFLNDDLVGLESVNSPADHLAMRRLLKTDARRPKLEEVADPAFDIRELARELVS